jgi:isoleucyl-tRNA synthetase
VNEIIFVAQAGSDGPGVKLNTTITPELRKKGIARDIIRSIQELRKNEGLTVGDKVALLLDSDEKTKELINEYLREIKKVTLVTGIEYTHLPNAQELAVEEYKLKIGFKK